MVNKFFALIALILTMCHMSAFGDTTSVISSTIPNTPNSRVVDLAHLLTINEQQTLNTKLRNIRNTTNGVEIQILTIPSLNGEVIEDVALDVGRKWKIGHFGINNGVLILVAANEHKYRIEIGYGLEGTLPDGYAGRSGREFLAPNFKNRAYYQGFNLLIDNLMAQINRSGEYQKNQPKSNNTTINLVEAIVGAFAFIIICLIMVYINQKKSRLNTYPSKKQKSTLASALWGILIGIIFSRLFNGSNGGSGSSGDSNSSSGFDNNDSFDDIGGGGGFGGGGSSGDY